MADAYLVLRRVDYPSRSYVSVISPYPNASYEEAHAELKRHVEIMYGEPLSDGDVHRYADPRGDRAATFWIAKLDVSH